MNQPSYALRHAKILVCDHLKGRVELVYQDRLLPYKIFERGYQLAPVIQPKNLEAIVPQGST